MDMATQVDISVKRLATRIGISEEYATILLIKYHWNEDIIVQNWNGSNTNSELLNNPPQNWLSLQVARVITFIKEHMWGLLSILLFGVLVCRCCDVMTLGCIGELTILNIVACYAVWGNIIKMMLIYFILKLLLTKSLLLVAVYSSLVTLVLIFEAIFCCLRSIFRFISRIFRRG